MNVKLYVGNLPKSITQGELTTLFNQAGEVIVADLITDRNNDESKGFAFVTMNSRSVQKEPFACLMRILGTNIE